MTRGQFERVFDGLPKRRREVLELFLAGVKDEEIARILNIKEGTVRSHIRNSCDGFGLENLHEDDYSSRRGDLIELFKRYKPELVKEEERSPFDPSFVGREEAIADLNAVVQNGAKCIQILSAGGQGKTTLAWRFLKTRFAEKDILYFPIGKETKDIASIESLVEERLRQLGEEPGREFLVSLERLRERLTRQPMGVLIDNLEPALDESNRFVAQHRSYVELFKQVLLSPEVRSLTLITSRAPLQEGLAIKKYALKPLNVEAWEQYFQHWKIVTDATVLQAVHGTYNGNALAMEILGSGIQDEEDYEHSLAAYWADNKTEDGVYIEDPVLNLIREQFNSLERLKPDAYKLLCRMGCFRYQDVPTVPEEGLFCLLWDVPESQHKRVVKVLKNRALVNVVDGEYRLHPVVRSEALEKLRESKDWEQSNRSAGEFWIDRVKAIKTIEDALMALEPYYHFLSIEDRESCCMVLLKTRGSNWDQDETLGRALYRLGLLQQTLDMIEQLIDTNLIEYLPDSSAVYNLCGVIYRIQGNLISAINSYKKAEFLAIKFKNEEYHLVSLLNIALYKIDIGKINEAVLVIDNYHKLAKEYKVLHHEKISWFCLAFLYSMTERIEDASKFIELSQNNKEINHTPWSTGNRLLFLGKACQNIKLINDAFSLYNDGMNFAKNNYYSQVEAKALMGLAELHRIRSNFEESLNNHIESIQILEKIGAKCDLAEAHYQLALTYQAMNNPESQTHFNKALELWTEIDAPKQCDRVRNSMNNPSH